MEAKFANVSPVPLMLLNVSRYLRPLDHAAAREDGQVMVGSLPASEGAQKVADGTSLDKTTTVGRSHT